MSVTQSRVARSTAALLAVGLSLSALLSVPQDGPK